MATPFEQGDIYFFYRPKVDVESVSGFSGHADRNGLEHFVGTMHPRPEEVFCVHGDETATDQLSSALYEKFNMRTSAPMNLETRRFD